MSGDTPGHERLLGNINTISRGTGSELESDGQALGMNRKVARQSVGVDRKVLGVGKWGQSFKN
jgi:hypothetical protein